MSFYKYTEIGFEGVRLLDGYSIGKDEFGPYHEIDAFSQLHREILKALCTCNVNLDGGMIYAMRLELDMKQSDLGEMLDLRGRQMMSYYENNKRPMPRITQEVLKRKVLSKLEGGISVRLWDKQIAVAAPKFFDFSFKSGAWTWVSSPHKTMEASFNEFPVTLQTQYRVQIDPATSPTLEASHWWAEGCQVIGTKHAHGFEPGCESYGYAIP